MVRILKGSSLHARLALLVVLGPPCRNAPLLAKCGALPKRVAPGETRHLTAVPYGSSTCSNSGEWVDGG
jgi:hypothetical protein